MKTPLKITFHLDGSGVFFDLNEPLHLDALVQWAVVPFQSKTPAPARDEPVAEIKLPLGKWEIGGQWGFRASALFPEGPRSESLQYWVKNFRENRADLCRQNPNLKMSIYRDYKMPMPLLLCRKMTAFAFANRKTLLPLLRRHIKYIGRKKAYGKGRVCGIDCEVIEQDFSLVKDGKAQRFLPAETGVRLVRPRPPYWNRVGRVLCCEVGDTYEYAG